MRICYLIPEFPGQTHAFFWRESKELARLGVESVFVSTRRPPRRIKSHVWGPEAEAATTYLFPLKLGVLLPTLLVVLVAGPAGWWRALRSALIEAEGGVKARLQNLLLIFMGARLARIVGRTGCDHVHVHSCAKAAMVALLAHRLTGVSYSMTLHGPIRDYGPSQTIKWRYARFAIIITKKLYDEAHDQLAGYLPQQVRIAPMGVALDNFDRRRPYEAYRGEGPARLFSCGRLNVIKGHRELIQAVALMRQRGFDVTATIAGEDEQGGTGFRKTLEELLSELGLGEHVRLLGAVSEDIVRAELEAAHAFVLPSYHEPLGVAIMEAMAMQTPVVTTRQGGVTELVTEGVDGLLVDAKCVQSLADAVMQLLADSDMAARFSRSSRLKIERAFHSGVSAAQIIGLLKQTNAHTRQSPQPQDTVAPNP
ncbi:MAG: exopolysaccharide biosynthesis GT4 family glycosyltransferase EpsE [Planctomycetota bacterium]